MSNQAEHALKRQAPLPAWASLRHEFVATEVVAPEERSAFWRDMCVRRYEPFGSAGTDDVPFAASVRKLIMPEGEFTDLRMSATSITRTQKRCRADGNDDIVISVGLAGGGAAWFGSPDETQRLGSGILRIRDQASPYVIQWTGEDNHTLHMELPRARFDQRTRERIVAAAGLPVPIHGLVPMLVGQMRALAAIAPGVDAAARAAGLRSLIDLAGTVLSLEFGSASADSEACENGMLIAARALISRRFASCDLSPDEIAHRLGCSRAHLYRLFARNGLTVAGCLREVRLQRALAALKRAGPREGVADIAFRSGFDNATYFSQVFRSRFGIRPSEALRRA